MQREVLAVHIFDGTRDEARRTPWPSSDTHHCTAPPRTQAALTSVDGLGVPELRKLCTSLLEPLLPYNK